MENDSQKISFPCIACGEKSHLLYATKKGFRVWKCAGCGMLSVYPVPAFEVSKNVYGGDYFSGAEKGHGYVDYDADKEAMRPVFERHLAHFEKALGRNGRLFDVGAATGYFMHMAKARGWDVHGVDISEFAAAQGRSRGLDLIAGTIKNETRPDGSYDLVTMWDVIEHMPDPVSDVRKAHRMLRSRGLLAINTPDSGSLYARLMGRRWHLLVPPEHLSYFNRQSISKLLKKQGFKVIEIGCIGKRFTLEYIVNFLYLWQKLSIWKKLAEWLKRSRCGQWAIPINLRDNMYVLARKE